MTDARIDAALARLTTLELRLDQLRDGLRSGWKQIAAGLRCSERAARDWANRNSDPLPVDIGPGGERTIPESRLRDWAHRNTVSYQHGMEIERLRAEVQRLRSELNKVRQGTLPPETAREATTGVVRRRPPKLPAAAT